MNLLVSVPLAFCVPVYETQFRCDQEVTQDYVEKDIITSDPSLVNRDLATALLIAHKNWVKGKD